MSATEDRESSEEQEADDLLDEFYGAAVNHDHARSLKTSYWPQYEAHYKKMRAALKSALLAAVSPARAPASSDTERLDAARKALVEYGRHYDWCLSRDDRGTPCNCGFAAAARAARASQPDPTEGPK